MEYDFNPIGTQELRNNFWPFYQTVRKAHPDTPIIFATHPYFDTATARDRNRISTVFEFYGKAMAEGDRKVWFIDGESFFPPEMRDLYAVDYLHPNDLGNYFMAKAMYPTLRQAIYG